MSTRAASRRRYFIRISASMAIYVASLIVASTLIESGRASGALAFVLALIPGLAVVGTFWAVGRFIVEQSDEFLRMLMIRQQMIAAGFAMSVAVVWGFLEQFALAPHAEAYWIVVVWAFGNGLGALSNRLTHGSWGECW